MALQVSLTDATLKFLVFFMYAFQTPRQKVKKE